MLVKKMICEHKFEAHLLVYHIKNTVCHTSFKIKILVLKEIIPQDSVREYRTMGCRIPENRALSVQILLISEVDREVQAHDRST